MATSQIDVMRRSVDEKASPPRSQLMVNRQYAVSGSLQVAAITSKAIGGSVSAATRPPKEVRDPQTNANLYTSDFGCDMMVGFDNSQKADRFPDQSRGD